jgi:hypothetical protein
MVMPEENGPPEGYIIWEENMKNCLEGREYLFGLELLGIRYKYVVGCCEYGNEHSGYTVMMNCFTAEEAIASQEELCIKDAVT